MAAVDLTISGVLYDKTARTMRPVVLIGEASLTGVGVGGGPVIPPDGGGGGSPPGTWGGAGEPFPTPPIHLPPHERPPGTWGGANEPFPTPPIYIPPAVPPGMQPPTPPNPGDPTTVVPGTYPVQPVTPPPYIVVTYPGIGPVTVAPPLQTTPS